MMRFKQPIEGIVIKVDGNIFFKCTIEFAL